jgi:hypothetical protein
MGVNGQKRKKKQGPVPSLEESLPKKFKSEKSVKPKKTENGVKPNGSAKLVSKKVNNAKVIVQQQPDDEEVVDGQQDFGATKASLFDDDGDDGFEADEFDGLEDNVDM